MPEILANLKSHIYPLFKKIFDFQGLTMSIYVKNHAEFESANDSIDLYGKNRVHIDFSEKFKIQFFKNRAKNL